MRWRFGGDLGTNSLGWSVLELDSDGNPFRIVALGSRIFSDGRDPKSKQSLAADRRVARAMRRRRDRFKQRQGALLKHLTLAGLFPTAEDREARARLQDSDPFELRARALHGPLTPHELGRALFHLNQRRGFKSNRKTDRRDNEAGKIKTGVSRLHQAMTLAGAETFGEFLHQRRAAAIDANHIPSVRTRLRPETGDGTRGDGYDFYPDRALLEQEFRTIVERQSEWHGALLTEDVQARLFEIAFNQRPLKPPKVGKCTLLYHLGEDRLPRWHPLFQRRRLLEEVNHLRVVRTGAADERLTLEQRDALLLKLKTARKVSFETLRSRVLRLDSSLRFNKETANRTELKGDEVAAEMAAKTRFGPRWTALPIVAQTEIVRRIGEAQSEADERALVGWLMATHGLATEQAVAAANASLPDGYGRFGFTATTRLVETMEAEVITFSEAVARAGLGHHSDFRTGEVLADLPYYGRVLERHVLPGTGNPGHDDVERHGRLTNPTVHIGLNQLRAVMNRLIKRYGMPDQIALELARELKLNEDEKKRREKENRNNQAAAERRGRKLEEIGQPNTGANRALLGLWEELNTTDPLDRRCVYTGQQIGIHMLFSSEVEVDHILPFSMTLDDSRANKIVCLREANRRKRKRTPHDAFSSSPADWEEIAARAGKLPANKRWRFAADAMERFNKDHDFIARQLTDTQHLARLSREYLASLFPGSGEGSGKVWVTTGRLTEMLRRKWGLNSCLPDHNIGAGAAQEKNRLDHRHHAIDAVVVGVTDRPLLQRIARAAGQDGADAAERLIADPPWESFRDNLQEAIGKVVTSHRPDHGTASKVGLAAGRDATAGRLHNDTAYGLTGYKENGAELVVHRIPLQALTPDDLVEGGRRVADKRLRSALHVATKGLEGKAFTEAVARFGQTDRRFSGMRRIRVQEPLSVIPIRDRNGVAYKGYKGDSNFRYDVWDVGGGQWVAEVVSMFDAHRVTWTSNVRNTRHNARKVLSLHRDDIIAVDRGSGRELFRVAFFSDRQLALAAPNQGGSLRDRDRDSNDPFKYVYPAPSRLRQWQVRQVRIDELGRVMDPGPRPVAIAAE